MKSLATGGPSQSDINLLSTFATAPIRSGEASPIIVSALFHSEEFWAFAVESAAASTVLHYECDAWLPVVEFAFVGSNENITCDKFIQAIWVLDCKGHSSGTSQTGANDCISFWDL